MKWNKLISADQLPGFKQVLDVESDEHKEPFLLCNSQDKDVVLVEYQNTTQRHGSVPLRSYWVSHGSSGRMDYDDSLVERFTHIMFLEFSFSEDQ